MNKKSSVTRMLPWFIPFYRGKIFIGITLLAILCSPLRASGQVENPYPTYLFPQAGSGDTPPTQDSGGSGNLQIVLDGQNPGKQSDGNQIFLPMVTTQLPTIIPESTNILTDESNRFLVSISADNSQFVFSQTTPEIDKVEPGEIIVSDIAPNAPNGYFQKVLTKQLVNGQVILTTGPAILEEAIEQASVSYSYNLTSDDIIETNALPGVALAIQEVNSPNYDVISLQIDKALLGGNLVASGSFDMSVELDFSFEIGHFSLKSLRMALVGTEAASLSLTSTYETSGFDEVEIARFKIRTLTIPVGGFPIVVQPTIHVVLGVDGTISASLSTGLTQSASLTGGVEYVDGDLRPVNTFTNEFTYQEPSLSAEMDIKAYVEAELELDFYSTFPLVPELELKVRGGPRLQADETLCWVLKGFLEADLEVELKVFKWDLAEFNEQIFSEEAILMHAKQCTLLEVLPPIGPAAVGTHVVASASNNNAQVYDYQEDIKQSTPGEIGDITLTSVATADAAGSYAQTLMTASVTYETVTNSLGIPSIIGGTVVFDIGWMFNPNNLDETQFGMTEGSYYVYINPHVPGDIVLNISSQVNINGYYNNNGGGWVGFGNESAYIPHNGNIVITSSLETNPPYHTQRYEFRIRPIDIYYDPINITSGSGTASTTVQWTFYPGGVPPEVNPDTADIALATANNPQ